MKKVLSIAGSSSMGGAGIQADLKTFQELEVYGMAAITAIVTISEQKGRHIFPQTIESLEAQVLTALEKTGFEALKTGMVYSEEQVDYISQIIKKYNISHVVIDPVIVTKSGAEIVEKKAIQKLKDVLLSSATIVTPNVPEAIKLSGLANIDTIEDMKTAARRIHACGPKYVIVKGGRMETEQAVDVLYDGEQFVTFSTKRIQTDTNGAGCTFSAAITAELAKGETVAKAVENAKAYITGAIEESFSFKGDNKRINHTAHRIGKMYPNIHISKL